MNSIPRRLSLVSQTVACLETAIGAKQWRDWLPAERAGFKHAAVDRVVEVF